MGLGGNNLAGRRLAGVNLRLRGLALGWGGALLADEGFLFHSHLGFSRIDLTALRNTLVQANGQTKLQTPAIFKTPETTVRQGDRGRAAFPRADEKGLNINPCGLII
jgi:hypothetical protein